MALIKFRRLPWAGHVTRRNVVYQRKPCEKQFTDREG